MGSAGELGGEGGRRGGWGYVRGNRMIGKGVEEKAYQGG